MSNKEESKKDILFYNYQDNSILSLQKYLNYSKQKRIKFRGGSQNILYHKGEESRNKDNEKGLNLSGLDPSTSLYNNNNFQKIETRNEEKKNLRSSSVCYSSNNNHDN